MALVPNFHIVADCLHLRDRTSFQADFLLGIQLLHGESNAPDYSPEECNVIVERCIFRHGFATLGLQTNLWHCLKQAAFTYETRENRNLVRESKKEDT